MDWQTVEREARSIAQAVWSAPCVAETVNGVRCDGVIRLKADHWVLIEVSKSNTLAKLREDLAKFGLLKPYLMSQQVYAECFFITLQEASSLKESAGGIAVEIHTLATFASKFLGLGPYLHERKLMPFGSAVNPETGAVDPAPYTHISYAGPDGKPYSITTILHELKKGRHVVLVGEFGTGKSRCVMEVFSQLATSGSAFQPIAINLRDHWGFRRFNPMLMDHLERLGLAKYSDSLTRSARRGQHILLLDGFDEIGSQSWSGAPDRLREIRRTSSEAVRDLLTVTAGSGVLITGRDHYFDSDIEMQECLGLSDNFLLLRCPEEFTEQEAASYIISVTGLKTIPEWMPKKPLICQLLARLGDDEMKVIQEGATGEVQFFESVFKAICDRETKIHASVESATLRGILLGLAQDSRAQGESEETITPDEINASFYHATGYAPLDEAAILLQRLPYLGRFGPGSPNRRFIDTYAKDGLRGLAEAEAIARFDEKTARAAWQQPLGDFGVEVLASKASPEAHLRFARHAATHGNQQVGCDYVAALNFLKEGDCDFGGLFLSGGSIRRMAFVGSKYSRLTASNMYIDRIIVEDAQFAELVFSNCIFGTVQGIGSFAGLPDVFGHDCEAERFEPALTVSRISLLGASNSHKTLMALIKKLFFQPGGARQEDALLRGAEAYWDAAAADKALKYMEANHMVNRRRGAHGTIFVPQRRFTRRMGKIMDLRSNSGDPLWSHVAD